MIYEIEVKSLLGNGDFAKKFKDKLKTVSSSIEFVSKNKQLNHYFTGGDVNILYDNISVYIPENEKSLFKKNIQEGKKHSIRTRKMDDKIILVLKASIDDMTSSNGVSRMEFECEFPELSLDDLDKVLIDSGFSYQAKWSREREEYKLEDINICIDKNAGYGYLAEFEMVIDDNSKESYAKEKIYKLMKKVEAEELQQDRLERMFDYYNENWEQYYGTDKVFVIE